MMRRSKPGHAGFSLVELAVVLVVLGLVALVLVRFLGTAARERHEVASRDLLTRADDALLAFAMVESRLPCPASDADGEEDCGSGQVGLLPYRALGLPDAGARRIRYGVLRRSGGAANADADLTRDIDRFYPFSVQSGTDTALDLPLGEGNGLDLCWALRNGATATPDAGFLHVTRPDAGTQMQAHVAYALALPAAGSGFTGHQGGSAPVFDSPLRPHDADFRDRVVAVGLDQLWSRMRCGDNLAAAGHAHFNAAASITLMHTAMVDYKKQLAVSLKLAEANVDNATAAVLSGTSATAGAAGGVADTVAEGLLTMGAVSTYKVALAATATAAAVAVTVTAATMTGFADQAKSAAEDAYEDVDPVITSASAIEGQVRRNAIDADDIGLYSPEET